MDYRFEEVQNLKFSVYDIDNDTVGLDDDDFLGAIECTLAEVGVTILDHVTYHVTDVMPLYRL